MPNRVDNADGDFAIVNQVGDVGQGRSSDGGAPVSVILSNAVGCLVGALVVAIFHVSYSLMRSMVWTQRTLNSAVSRSQAALLQNPVLAENIRCQSSLGEFLFGLRFFSGALQRLGDNIHFDFPRHHKNPIDIAK